MALLQPSSNETTLAPERDSELPQPANGNGNHAGDDAQWTHNRINGKPAWVGHSRSNRSVVLSFRKPGGLVDHQTANGQGGIAKEDAADMACLCRGDDEAMTRLMRRHASRLQGVISRVLKDSAEAADVVEETFIRVYRHRERFDLRAKFTTWLYTIALNQARNRLRSRARKPEFVSLDELTEEELESQQFAASEPAPDVSLEKLEFARGLEASLASLPSQLREPLEIFAWDDYSQAEIAKLFNCSPKAIELRLYHARQRLRAELDHLLHPRAACLFVSPFKHQHETKTKT